jgi:large subunit ribosomal protein L10
MMPRMQRAEAEKRVADWKKKEVEELKELMKGKNTVGIVDVSSLPSAQFQEIRKKLRGKADLRIAKSILITRAIEELGDSKLKALEGCIKGPSGLLVSDENPFLLYKFIVQNRSKAAAKAGMVAKDDIVVPAGETEMPAGPALAELKQAGIDVKIDKGKIAISKDSTVAKKGAVITPAVANALSKVGIMPMEIGLKVSGIYEKGIIYGPDVLYIDEVKFMSDLKGAFMSALNLSVFAGYTNSVSIKYMIQKAYRNARGVAMETNFMTQETVGPILGKANNQANALAGLLKTKGFA